jgi:uncharacterized protein (DUF1800 family)
MKDPSMFNAVRRILRLAALLLLLPQVTLVWAGPTEQALITSYYQSILRRAPDPGGLAYWDSEATRLRDAGQDAKEAFIAMSSQFFDSAEYRGFNRNNAAFVTDAYLAFFQRVPDSGGLAYWQGQLAQGLPRGIVLAGFQFSAEFSSYIDARLGVGSARIEGTVIVDFYRGYLNRLPDGAGLAYWIAQFRTAQCKSAVDLYNSADAISSQFLSSGEYASRARSDADFVADLYSAFLRRGGDLAGAQYWIELLRTGTSRDAVRRAFLDSPEFRARLAAVMVAGCYVVPTVVDADVWRLLQQATFGPSQAEAARVGSTGIPGWIEDQFAQPPSGYPDSVYNRIQLKQTVDCGQKDATGVAHPTTAPEYVCYRDHLTPAGLQRHFFTNATKQPDQLRQRVAWALSQIHVVSTTEADLAIAYPMARYQNILFDEAFGNFENLLRRVTLSPAMGNYLDMVNNDKPNPATGRVPNENYAREVLQLFSIGLVELRSDGTPLLDTTGAEIESYDQGEIKQFARAFTGWTYPKADGTAATGKNPAYYASSMIPYPNGHDVDAKLLLGGVTLPAARTAQQDLDAAIHNIFAHPNVGPFIGRQLIQRLVTDDPSPAYVARVAAVFADNGAGVRGDMKALVRAILLDAEARGPAKTDPRFGQLKEPVLMVTGLVRALSGVTDGKGLADVSGGLGQRPYASPSVFNYFPPDYTVPGTDILGPEFAIHNSNSAVARTNRVYDLVYSGIAVDATVPDATGTALNTQQFEPLASNPLNLVNAVDNVLLGGHLPTAARDLIVTAVTAIPATATNYRASRAKMAVYLMASSFHFQVQR